MPRLILIRHRWLARSNQMRSLSRLRWRLVPMALGATIVTIYGVLWAQSVIQEFARLHLVDQSQIILVAGGVCAAIGLIAGFAATGQDRVAASAPFLAVLPWPDRARREAILLSLLFRLASSALLVFLAIRFGHAAPNGLHDVALYAGGFILGCGLDALRQHRAVSAPPAARRRPAVIWFARLDHAAPCWAGWWTLASRLPRALLVAIVSLAGSLSLAEAASRSTPPASIAPALAAVGPLIVLISAINCAPLISPVLRTTSIRYHRAALAMLRLPAGLAAAWFAAFGIAALMLDLTRLRALAAAGGIALLLGGGYALAALSIPNSSRLAVGFYLIALIFAADQYASMQNLVFVVLLGLLIVLVFRARARFRGAG